MFGDNEMNLVAESNNKTAFKYVNKLLMIKGRKFLNTQRIEYQIDYKNDTLIIDSSDYDLITFNKVNKDRIKSMFSYKLNNG